MEQVEETIAGHQVVLRKRMGWGIRNQVQSDAVRVLFDDKGKPHPQFVIGAYQIALLKHNVLSFDGAPLTPDMLDDLDQDVGEAILQRINDLNMEQAPVPNSKAAGNSGSTGRAKPQRGTGTPRS